MSSRKRKLINKKAKVEIERYPLVEVEWIDIVSDASWQSLKDLERAQPAKVITKGHLFSDIKVVKVFSDYALNEHDKTKIDEVGNTTVTMRPSWRDV
jgi:hypothetical protein